MDPKAAPLNPVKVTSQKVLVVEDEADARDIFTDLLTSAGYEVAAAVDGVDALAKLEASKGEFKLVLLDIIMPNKDGVETLEDIIKSPEKYGAPKVLMLTNIGGDAAVEKAVQLGAVGYLLKSETEPQQLLDIVTKYLNDQPVAKVNGSSSKISTVDFTSDDAKPAPAADVAKAA